MAISLEEHWIWDSWYIHDGKIWHGYFLMAPKSIGDPDLRHWNVSIGHAVSTDLTNWEHKGVCFSPSKNPAWDDYTTWTGSVIGDKLGNWHLFYTGTSRAENGMYQRIGHAISEDLHSWQRVGDGLCLDMIGSNAKSYEDHHNPQIWHDRAMRDPWVMENPEGDGWVMYFTARVQNIKEANEGGAIGFATSLDLNNWQLEEPVYSGGFGQLEVPQVFEIKGRWYCLFCTDAKHYSMQLLGNPEVEPLTGTHYLMADSPKGPWTVAKGSFFDGSMPCKRYASRIVELESGYRILGFRDVESDQEFGGYVTDPDIVTIKENGALEIESTG